MHASAPSSNVEVIRLLLQFGASTKSRNDVEETPLLRFALKMSSHTIRKDGVNHRILAFRELLNAGSDVNARDDQGRTALHFLALDRFSDKEGYKTEAARMLLAGGADVLVEDGMGRTTADLVREGNTGLGELLRSSV